MAARRLPARFTSCRTALARRLSSLFLVAAVFTLRADALSAQDHPVDPPRYSPQAFAPDAQQRYTAAQIALLEKLNRRDREHLARLTTVIAPDVWVDDELVYSPLPREWPWAASHAKALVVHQPAQVFGAYEWGRLVRWGPVSTGRQETPTPSGVFSLTWRSRSRRSTDNAEWILNWYFNFINSRGISFHEFELPGRPASHACVRLLTRDAEWVYGWGEQWRITPDGREVITPGSTVVILGAYDFTRPPPWLSPDSWSTTLALPPSLP